MKSIAAEPSMTELHDLEVYARVRTEILERSDLSESAISEAASVLVGGCNALTPRADPKSQFDDPLEDLADMLWEWIWSKPPRRHLHPPLNKLDDSQLFWVLAWVLITKARSDAGADSVAVMRGFALGVRAMEALNEAELVPGSRQ